MSFWTNVRCDGYRYLSQPEEKAGTGIFAWVRLTLFAPGFQVAFSIRLQAVLLRLPVVGRILRRILWYVTTIYFGCDISPGARFGPGLYMPHPTGIVIGQEWDIGANFTMLQGATLGRINRPKRRCRIGDGVFIGAGARLLGQIDIGNDARIGANAVVLQTVQAGATAVGVPARIVARPVDAADEPAS